jgi:hypothetical protein
MPTLQRRKWGQEGIATRVLRSGERSKLTNELGAYQHVVVFKTMGLDKITSVFVDTEEGQGHAEPQ